MFGLDLAQLPLADLIATATVLVLLIGARLIAGRMIRGSEMAPVQKRRWISTVRNAAFALGVLALALVWAPQLQTFALSLTAVAVAVVIATKELLLCFSGAILRSSARAFAVGDWIEISGIRGEVVDQGVLATTIHEFEPGHGSFQFSGRTAVIPNSVLLASPVRNLAARRDRFLHGFDLTFRATTDVFGHRREIEDIVARHAAAHAPPAPTPRPTPSARGRAKPQNDRRLDPVDTAPRIRLLTTDLGHHRIHVAIHCPPEAAEEIQNEIATEIVLLLGPPEDEEA